MVFSSGEEEAVEVTSLLPQPRESPHDTRITIDELVGAPPAGPSSQGRGFSEAAAAGDDICAAARVNIDAPEDWKTRGILNTVKPNDNDEIYRLRGLVDTRLHVAVRAQDLTALCELLAAGASPAALDWKGRTPLHLCVVHRLMDPFKVLLAAPGAADVRDASGWPLLHAALLHGWRDGARAALAAGARVDATGLKRINKSDLSPQHCRNKRYPDIQLLSFLDSLPQSPIEIAIKRDMEMLEPILSVAKDSGVIDCLNIIGRTALYIAIRLHNLPAIKILLKYGASPQKVSDKEETALHAAIPHPDILKYLLHNTNVQSTLDNSKRGLAPEHLAVLTQKPDSLILLLDKFKNTRLKTRLKENTPLHLAAIKGGDKMAKIILKRDKGVQVMFEVNAQGYTPLHMAAKHNNKELAALLLLNGANLSTKTKNKEETTVLELISTRFYDAGNYFESLFDGFIYNAVNKKGNTFVKSDYEVLTNGEGMSQIKVLEEFVRCDRSKALLHPLIASLLYLKWKHFQPLFFALLGLYGIFLVFFNSLIVCIFYLEDTSNNTMNMNNSLQASPMSDAEAADSTGFHGGWYWLLIVLTYISILTLTLQECMFINLKRRDYFRSVESWVKLVGLVLSAATPPLAALAPEPWPRHAACAAILFVWAQAMFLVSRFSGCGYYIPMFGKVAVNIFKILVTAVFLVIAFACCFMIQYHSAPPFDNPFAAFVKTLVMMSSEFEYENLFGENHDIHLKGTRWVVRTLFVVFVIFMAIVLMNFMIGVAVSDINDLNETAKIRRSEKQVELLSTFELLAYDGVLAKWFIKLFGDKKYHSLMYTFRGNKSKSHVKIRKHPYTENSQSDIVYPIQIRSSKLYHAILETPSKQQQQDQEAAKHNTEKPYRSQKNAFYNELADKMADDCRKGEDDDLIKRREDNLDKQKHLSSLASDSSKMSRDIEILKQRNEDLNLQISILSGIALDILEKIKALSQLDVARANGTASAPTRGAQQQPTGE